MTWDGQPLHRNLGDHEAEPPRGTADFLRDLFSGPPRPPVPSMPADPFNGLTEPAVAQVAMIEAVRDAGLTEAQALFYVACLVQVGLAIQQGGLLDQWRQPPEPS